MGAGHRNHSAVSKQVGVHPLRPRDHRGGGIENLLDDGETSPRDISNNPEIGSDGELIIVKAFDQTNAGSL